MTSLVRRFPRLAWFALGVAVTTGSMWLLWHWLDIARLFGVTGGYDRRPVWLRVLMTGVEWLPPIALALLVAMRAAGNRAVRPLAYAVGMVAPYAALVGALLLGPGIDEAWHRQRFEPVAWRRNAAANTMWPARLTMVDDLLARHPLRGLSRDSVERLLGPSDSSAYRGDWDLVYELGPERGLVRIDGERLVAKLGPDGRVAEYRVVRD